MAGITRLGAANGLQIDIALSPPSAQYQHGLAWGRLTLAVGGQTVWGCNDAAANASTLEWTLVDLLHGLARIWPWLMFEEGYPIQINPEHPGKMMVEAQARWGDMPPAEAEAEAEEDALYDFRQRHDLSLLLRGVKVAPLWLLKEGRDCLIWSPAARTAIRLAHDEVLKTLQQLGDFLHRALLMSQEPRARTAVARWEGRQRATVAQYLAIVTGLDTDQLRILVGAQDDDLAAVAAFFEQAANDNVLEEPNELLMAARMTHGFMSLHDQHALLLHIKSVKHADTLKLDTLSAATPPLDPGLTPYEQAYALADWLRSTLDLSPGEPVFPERLLSTWGIPVEEIDIAAPIDAAAVWGHRRGPCILLNRSDYSRAASENGYRTTLAHEICHLLVDRQRALPVVEVLGGQLSSRAEQRANAFAAELLLPRAVAAQACEAHPDLISAAAVLERRFRVSRELVSNQINNSDYRSRLDNATRRRLYDWKLETRPQRMN